MQGSTERCRCAAVWKDELLVDSSQQGEVIASVPLGSYIELRDVRPKPSFCCMYVVISDDRGHMFAAAARVLLPSKHSLLGPTH